MRPSVGVVLASCNGEAFIREQIESILGQTLRPDRIIVTDDGSTDRTAAIVEMLSRKTEGMALYRNEAPLGWIRNFEKGIRLCDADIIALCDQDDVWRPDKLERCVEIISARTNCGLCYHDAGLVQADGTPIDLTFWGVSGLGFPLDPETARSEILATRSPLPGFSLVFQRRLKRWLLPFPGKIHCAHDWWISAVAYFLFQPAAVPDRLMQHRIHAGQTIGDVAGRLKGTRHQLRKPLFSPERIRRSIRREVGRIVNRRRLRSERTADRQARRLEFSEAFGRLAELIRKQTADGSEPVRPDLLHRIRQAQRLLAGKKAAENGLLGQEP